MVKGLLITLRNLQQVHFKIASKRAIQKTAKVTGYLIGNTIANKITSI